ncbi:sugar phosphate isomerase/epimerase family protein [Paenibacillus spongiae]|uniref:Sugar phosphate isomerase/epimerase n=1 Tax=Paenibacillus spongiae TaxID=2909671 RepID=A0ABY5S2C3_9BACL|nr:sugar phosphate isomerase/epimerase family protein [Paenibacillus spongiae]UVI27593.1 sugar phosphate isomerase/epimerase [Paenibacillus spongiae]
MFSYSATQWIFGKEELKTSFERLRRFGYDGIELAGEPDTTDLDMVQVLMREHGLTCTSICGIYTAERDLTHQDAAIRSAAVHYVKDCIDMAAQLGAKVVIVVPTAVGRTSPYTSPEKEWEFAVESLREAGAYAASKGVRIAIEALNRFETYLVNKLETANKLAEQINHPYVGIMADLFHMNIEERDHVQALQMIARHLVHVHIADNTREAAGLGQTDFTAIVRTLIEIGYNGALTMEFLPPVSNPYAAAERIEANSVFDDYTKQSISHLKEIVDSLSVM